MFLFMFPKKNKSCEVFFFGFEFDHVCVLLRWSVRDLMASEPSKTCWTVEMSCSYGSRCYLKPLELSTATLEPVGGRLSWSRNPRDLSRSVSLLSRLLSIDGGGRRRRRGVHRAAVGAAGGGAEGVSGSTPRSPRCWPFQSGASIGTYSTLEKGYISCFTKYLFLSIS